MMKPYVVTLLACLLCILKGMTASSMRRALTSTLIQDVVHDRWTILNKGVVQSDCSQDCAICDIQGEEGCSQAVITAACRAKQNTIGHCQLTL